MTTADSPAPRRALDATRDADATVAVLHSSHVATSPLAAVLEALPCRVTSIPLDRRMSDEMGTQSPNVVVVDHASDDFNVVRVVRELSQLSGALIVVIAAPTVPVDEEWAAERLNDGAHVVISSRAQAGFILAQLRTVLRAAPRPERGPELLTVGDVTIDLGAHSLVIDGEPVPCTPVLFSLLVVLASAPNKVLPREALLARVWSVSPTPAHLRRVRIAASQLRRLLGDGPRRPRIETVARVGYCLAVDD